MGQVLDGSGRTMVAIGRAMAASPRESEGSGEALRRQGRVAIQLSLGSRPKSASHAPSKHLL